MGLRDFLKRWSKTKHLIERAEERIEEDYESQKDNAATSGRFPGASASEDARRELEED